MIEQWPKDLVQKMGSFLQNELTGSIELHIKHGQVEAWRITEHGKRRKGLHKTENRSSLEPVK